MRQKFKQNQMARAMWLPCDLDVEYVEYVESDGLWHCRPWWPQCSSNASGANLSCRRSTRSTTMIVYVVKMIWRIYIYIHIFIYVICHMYIYMCIYVIFTCIDSIRLHATTPRWRCDDENIHPWTWELIQASAEIQKRNLVVMEVEQNDKMTKFDKVTKVHEFMRLWEIWYKWMMC